VIIGRRLSSGSSASGGLQKVARLKRLEADYSMDTWHSRASDQAVSSNVTQLVGAADRVPWAGRFVSMEHKKTIKEILNAIEMKEENIQQIMDAFFEDGYCLVPCQDAPITTDITVYRARNQNPNELYVRKDQVTYPPSPDMVKTGRANMRGNQVFYGAVPVKPKDSPWVIAMQEVSEIRNGWIPPIQTFTVSRWKPRREVSIACFVPSELLAAGNDTAKAAHEKSVVMIEAMKEPYRSRACDLYGVLHDAFTKDVDGGDADGYWISAVFASMVYTQTNGISYPSKRGDYQGFNVAIPKAKWDKNFDLLQCIQFQQHTKGKETLVVPYRMTTSVEEPFTWVDHPLDPQVPPLPPFTMHPYPHKKPE
jgi:hypothetical protein